MNPVNVKDRLPPDRTYVLAHYTGGNWYSKDHQEGCEWKVVKFIQGISKAEREAMPECPRKHTQHGEDEQGNNRRPYCWDEFGPGKLFGQDVDFWCHLPVTHWQGVPFVNAKTKEPTAVCLRGSIPSASEIEAALEKAELKAKEG